MYNLFLLWFLQSFSLHIAKKNLFTANICSAHLLFQEPHRLIRVFYLCLFEVLILMSVLFWRSGKKLWTFSQKNRRTPRTGFSVSTQERFCLDRRSKENLILPTPYHISTIIQTMLMPMYLPHPKELLKDLFKDSISNIYKVWSLRLRHWKSWCYFD